MYYTSTKTSHYEIRVTRVPPIGSQVGGPVGAAFLASRQATDVHRSAAVRDRLVYTLTANAAHSLRLALDPRSSQLTVAGRIDREALCPGAGTRTRTIALADPSIRLHASKNKAQLSLKHICFTDGLVNEEELGVRKSEPLPAPVVMDSLLITREI